MSIDELRRFINKIEKLNPHWFYRVDFGEDSRKFEKETEYGI